MKYGNVPGFEKPISRIVLGTVPHSFFLNEDQVQEINDAFKAAGGNALDMAHNYGGGQGHRMVGNYFRKNKNREDFIIFDKGCHHYGRRRIERESLLSDIADNLYHLGFDYVDFYTLHRDDQLVPISKIVDWSNEVLERGLAKQFGGSNYIFRRLMAGNKYAEEQGKKGFAISSSNFSLALPNEPVWEDAHSISGLQLERDWYTETQFPLFSWSSGGGGFFADIDSGDVRRAYHNKYNWARRERVHEFAKKLGASPTAVALAWTLNQPMNIFCLIGPANVDQLKDNLTCLEVKLDPDELAYIENGK